MSVGSASILLVLLKQVMNSSLKEMKIPSQVMTTTHHPHGAHSEEAEVEVEVCEQPESAPGEIEKRPLCTFVDLVGMCKIWVSQEGGSLRYLLKV